MAKYRSPILLDDSPIDPGPISGVGESDSIRDLKDDISTSFVYGDDSYEEEYVVPDIVEEITVPEAFSEEPAE